MVPHFSSHLLLDQQKDEYLCSFIETVPRLVIRHLLQPVFRFLLRLAVVVAAAAAAAAAAATAVDPLLLPPPNSLQDC